MLRIEKIRVIVKINSIDTKLFIYEICYLKSVYKKN